MSNNMKEQKILALDAVILIANDFPGQCDFYKNVLGLQVKSRYDNAVFFGAGEQVLGVFAHSHHPQGTARLGGATHGISHLEFRLHEADRVTMFERLKKAGAHAYGDNFADNDGNLFHFNFV